MPTTKGKENVTDRYEHKYKHQLSDASSRISFIYENLTKISILLVSE